MPQPRLVVASNRLPVVARRDGDAWTLSGAPGGLVTALRQALAERQGVWVGWPGVVGDIDIGGELEAEGRVGGYRLRGVALSAEEHDLFYHGFCNEVIWPLFHDMPNLCRFDPAYFDAYVSVNAKYARAIGKVAEPGDFVWIHDYQLIDAGRQVREAGASNRLGFFLHIPFPARDLFLKLPWRAHLVRSLLAYDVLGFQTEHDLSNFVESLSALVPDVQFDREGARVRLEHQGRPVVAGAYPIGIDYARVRDRADSPEVLERAARVKARVPDRRFLLGVDRLDHSKGIPQRIRAFQRALETYPELCEKVTYIQVVSPSREDIPQYVKLREEIEGLVGEVNGAHYTWGWVPIHYLSRRIDYLDVLAWYRTADVAYITPLRDGMNLVAKEYVASRTDGDGVLILSEFAGAAEELGPHALLVNPFNVDAMARAVQRALTMPAGERRQRMAAMQEVIRTASVDRWVEAFLAGAGAPSLGVRQRTKVRPRGPARAAAAPI